MLMKRDAFLVGLQTIFDRDEGLRPATVARRAGLDNSTIRKMLDGTTTTANMATAEKIATALGTTVEAIRSGVVPDGQGRPPSYGFSEDQARPWMPDKSTLRAASPVLALSVGAKHPIAYEIMRPALPFGLLVGDVVIVDLGTDPVGGELILVGIIDAETGVTTTEVGRFFGDYLLGHDPLSPHALRKFDANTAWRGTIISMFRPAHRQAS